MYIYIYCKPPQSIEAIALVSLPEMGPVAKQQAFKARHRMLVVFDSDWLRSSRVRSRTRCMGRMKLMMVSV